MLSNPHSVAASQANWRIVHKFVNPLTQIQ